MKRVGLATPFPSLSCKRCLVHAIRKVHCLLVSVSLLHIPGGNSSNPTQRSIDLAHVTPESTKKYMVTDEGMVIRLVLES